MKRGSEIIPKLEEKKIAGVYDDLVRISVGIEDVQDLIEDFTQALKAAN